MYVVLNEHSVGRRKSLSAWYGPDRSFGTTSGPILDDDGALAYSAARFATADEARVALRSVYGTLYAANKRGYRVVPAEKAEQEGRRQRRNARARQRRREVASR